jgi:FlaG/FlaF family flagellin (archaellin)
MTDDAVSPVVGVMLMLVVTIVLAAVVSSFYGGIASDDVKPPQLTLSATPVIKGLSDADKTNEEPDYPNGFTANNGIMFKHAGGDGFSLKDIRVQIQSRDTKITLDYGDTFKSSASCADTSRLITNSNGDTLYFARVGGGTDDFILPGDIFMLVADGCYDSTEMAGGGAKYITWKPTDAHGTFKAQLYAPLEYKVIDKNSGKAIQTGSFVLR